MRAGAAGRHGPTPGHHPQHAAQADPGGRHVQALPRDETKTTGPRPYPVFRLEKEGGGRFLYTSLVILYMYVKNIIYTQML